SPLIYGNATEAWANFTVLQADHGATITLRRGGSNVASGTGNQTEKAILGVAAHSYDAVYSESQNYSQLTTSASTFTINKAGAAVNLVINGTRGYRNFSINEYVNFTVNVSAVIPQGINPLIEIWTNYTTTNGWKLWNESRVSGSVKYFSNITRLTAAGIYNFSANFTNENYTAYGTAFEAWYINITAASTDAAFSVAVPSDWTLNDITGTTEGSATAIPLSGFISFNMSLYGDSNFSQPNVDGVFTQNQSGASFPIYWIRNDGNVDITIQLRLDANPPAGIVIFANSSCATCTSGQAAPLTLTTSYQTFATGLGQGAPNYANITLWANASFNQAAGQNSINLYNCGKEPSATC
ncbi:MAG: hypothetical protein HYS53_02920, partial [Candidatus Aenigmarchaeota archaeon]|nr:hypothetical protein [Candidatus Aenigmarchaeota archaeon]